MSVITRNYYGNILITDEAIAQVVGNIALNSVGVADLVSKKFSDGLSDIFRRNRTSRGIRVLTNQDKIYIEVFMYILYGMSIESVSKLLKRKIKYGVEEFTGMSVVSININIVGVKLS